jgi:hypothetical protein
MTPAMTRLLEQAMRLSDEERADLAARLIDTLDPITDQPEDWESAWGEEIRQRLTALDQGSIQTIPWSEARRMIDDESGTE